MSLDVTILLSGPCSMTDSDWPFGEAAACALQPGQTDL